MRYDSTEALPLSCQTSERTKKHQISPLKGSKYMHESPFPMFFPILGAHMSCAKIRYSASIGRIFAGKWTTCLPKVEYEKG